jgi:hypothetical protein
VEDRRTPRPGGTPPVPVVQPPHVIAGCGNILGNPDVAPATLPSTPGPIPGPEGLGQLAGICDTGIWADAATVHPLWFAGSYNATPSDIDALYDGVGNLALQAGHGTFVAGVMRREAPSLNFDPAVALSPQGIGDEESVAAALASLDPSVSYVNLSLGCTTQDDVPSLPLANAIADLASDRPGGPVVVAAAGNAGSNRPTWPAALPGVIAVAALRRHAVLGLVPAGYSNYGNWVDLCAPGRHEGPYVVGNLVPPADPPLVFTGFAAWQGTSFATPYVVGRMAKMVTTLGISPQAAAALLCAGPKPFLGYGAVVP